MGGLARLDLLRSQLICGVYAARYSTDVDQLEAGPVALFDAALRMLHDIPQVHSSALCTAHLSLAQVQA